MTECEILIEQQKALNMNEEENMNALFRLNQECNTITFNEKICKHKKIMNSNSIIAFNEKDC